MHIPKSRYQILAVTIEHLCSFGRRELTRRAECGDAAVGDENGHSRLRDVMRAVDDSYITDEQGCVKRLLSQRCG
jgi:hypothetical protein